jgi:thioredoxin
MNRRAFLATLPAAALLPRLTTAAPVVYTPGTIDKYLDAGRTILVDFYAPWCGTCIVQHKRMDELKAENPAYEEHITFIEVDWDTYGRSELSMALKIPRRSTLVTIGPDRREISRVVAGTSREEIKALLDGALAVAMAPA